MSEDKLKDLSDLENRLGRPVGKKALNEEADDFKTREMNLEEISQKIRMEREKATLQHESLSPEPTEPASEDWEKKIMEATELLEPAPRETATAIAAEAEEIDAEEPLMTTPGDFPEAPAVSTTSTYGRRTSEPKVIGSSFRIIMIVGVVLLAIMIFFIFKPKPQKGEEPKTPLAAAGEQATPEDSSSGPETPEVGEEPEISTSVPAVSVKKQIPVYTLSPEDFQGKAPILAKEGGPVLGVKEDAEIAAFCDALKQRGAMIVGAKVQRGKDIVTTTISAEFSGFRVVATRQEKGEQTIRDEISVTLPHRGRFLTRESVLVSAAGVQYDKFLTDLAAAGVTLSKTELAQEGVMTVQLQFSKSASVPPAFLLNGDAAGLLPLGSSTDTLKRIYPDKSFNVLDKRVMNDENDEFYDTFKISDTRDESLCFVIMEKGKAIGVQILNPRYKTAKGAGLGDTLDKLRGLHSEGGIQITITPGGAVYASIAGGGLKFFLEHADLNFRLQNFPGAAKITSIILGESPFIK